MFRDFFQSFQRGQEGRELKRRLLIMYAFLIALNVGMWVLSFSVFGAFPRLLGICLMAYLLGLRHAVDADHIAAIDNVTRKLMQEKKQPAAVGFFSSLGHSSVVIIMTFFVALGANLLKEHPQLKNMGGLIGTAVSGLFLLLIALINFMIFIDIYRTFQQLRRGQGFSEETLEDFLNRRGLLSRMLRPVFKIVTKSWHMYALGFLFGLGFDTASEIAVLGIAAESAVNGLPIWSIMIFPLLFMAGMCLIDTTDGVLMLGAYGWAFVKPVRKLYYNMVITMVSFLIAFFIGSVEIAGIIAEKLQLTGFFWGYVRNISDHMGSMGYIMIAILLMSWFLSTLIYKISKLDSLGTVPSETSEM